jgi:hypothetical protein
MSMVDKRSYKSLTVDRNHQGAINKNKLFLLIEITQMYQIVDTFLKLLMNLCF